MNRLRIGIVGCGTIGSILARSIQRDFARHAQLVKIFDKVPEKARQLSRLLKRPSLVVSSLEGLIRASQLVIESASKEGAKKIVEESLRAGRDVMVMSVGALLENPSLLKLAARKGRRLYVPSGAICGLDGLRASHIAGLKEVTLTTRKPPLALEGAPYVVRQRIDLRNLRQEKVIFSGSAEEAIKAFPANINVAATLSLVGLGKKGTRVRVVASPDLERNVHEIEINSLAGRITIRCENVPAPGNPKTSYLAALSALVTLRGIFMPVKIGG